MGLLDDNVAEGSHMQSDTIVRDAEVAFTDGTTARFDAVEFLPDQRLKAYITTLVTVNGRDHHVTDITYYAAGSWRSVHEPPRGVLVADLEEPYGRKYAEAIAVGCFEHEVPQKVAEWMAKRWRGKFIAPKAPSDFSDRTELLSTEFECHQRPSNAAEVHQLVAKVRFRWVRPELPSEAAILRQAGVTGSWVGPDVPTGGVELAHE